MRVEANNTFHTSIADGVNEANITGVKTNLADGDWHHVAMVVDKAGKTMISYVDGYQDSSTSIASVGSLDNAYPLRIGSLDTPGNAQAYSFNGIIDEVRISILPHPEEIKQDAQRLPYSVYTSSVIDLTQATSANTFTWMGKGFRTADGEVPVSTSSPSCAVELQRYPVDGNRGKWRILWATCNGTLTGFSNTTAYDVVAGSGWTADNKRWGSGAVMFDGGNDFIDLGDPATGQYDLDAIKNFTVSFWVKGALQDSAIFLKQMDMLEQELPVGIFSQKTQ